MSGLDLVADPGQRAGAGILGDEPGGRGHDDAARERGVDEGGFARGLGLAGPRVHLALAVAMRCESEAGGAQGRELEELAAAQRAALRSGRGSRDVGAAVRGMGPHGPSVPSAPSSRSYMRGSGPLALTPTI